MSVLQHALYLKGGFGSAKTCLEMKQVQMMRSMLLTLCVYLALLLPQGMFLPCS